MAALSVDGTPMPALPNSADQINYDNTTSGLSATTVKGAVDELASEKQDATDNNLTTTNKTIVGGINELKSGLNDLMPKSVTAGHGITINSGGYIKIGRTVIVSLNITATEDITNPDQIIISGLPRYDGNWPLHMATVSDKYNVNALTRTWLGNLICGLALTSGNSYIITGIYTADA